MAHTGRDKTPVGAVAVIPRNPSGFGLKERSRHRRLKVHAVPPEAIRSRAQLADRQIALWIDDHNLLPCHARSGPAGAVQEVVHGDIKVLEGESLGKRSKPPIPIEVGLAIGR